MILNTALASQSTARTPRDIATVKADVLAAVAVVKVPAGVAAVALALAITKKLEDKK